jgi:hypothetical protein
MQRLCRALSHLDSSRSKVRSKSGRLIFVGFLKSSLLLLLALEIARVSTHEMKDLTEMLLLNPRFLSLSLSTSKIFVTLSHPFASPSVSVHRVLLSVHLFASVQSWNDKGKHEQLLSTLSRALPSCTSLHSLKLRMTTYHLCLSVSAHYDRS